MSFRFGQASLEALETCDYRLVQLAHETLTEGEFDFAARDGHRERELQDYYHSIGASRVKWPHGKHNSTPSRAIHFIPYPVDWENLYNFVYLAGVVRVVARGLGFRIRWGGNWDQDHIIIKDQSFNDLSHYELID